ncbi:exonuclease SbcC [Salmonella enterica subsp. enterica]|uniref:Exonuclease SbcC n=1 Tax=Salmonella enterica I TaxID=59201 RepID=A0A379WYU5_SALET|nr:exonuclease SbcC [Salmonella enterica subsp. enterica]
MKETVTRLEKQQQTLESQLQQAKALSAQVRAGAG